MNGKPDVVVVRAASTAVECVPGWLRLPEAMAEWLRAQAPGRVVVEDLRPSTHVLGVALGEATLAEIDALGGTLTRTELVAGALGVEQVFRLDMGGWELRARFRLPEVSDAG